MSTTTIYYVERVQPTIVRFTSRFPTPEAARMHVRELGRVHPDHEYQIVCIMTTEEVLCPSTLTVGDRVAYCILAADGQHFGYHNSEHGEWAWPTDGPLHATEEN